MKIYVIIGRKGVFYNMYISGVSMAGECPMRPLVEIMVGQPAYWAID